MPELEGVGLIGHVAQRLRDAAALDLPEHLAGELEVVALLVDRPRPAAFDQDAVFGGVDEVFGGVSLAPRLQAHVGHALERHAVVALAVAAAAALGFADPRRLVARGLPPDEDAVADEVPALARHAVVVPTDGREPARLRAVGDEVDELAAEAEPARVVRAEEARPGEVRLEIGRASCRGSRGVRTEAGALIE